LNIGQRQSYFLDLIGTQGCVKKKKKTAKKYQKSNEMKNGWN